MARTVKKPIGPFRPEATTFENGKDRPIEVTLYPQYIEIRVVGLQSRFHVPYGAILRMGAEQEVHHRIRRGVL